MALTRLLLAVLLTCADCLQTEGEWHAALGNSEPGDEEKPKDGDDKSSESSDTSKGGDEQAPDTAKDAVCYVKAGHIFGFHTSDLSEGPLKKIKNTADTIFSPLDYVWGMVTQRRYLVGMKVTPWGGEDSPTSCDATEIFKWSLVQQGATNSDGPVPKSHDNDAAKKALEGVGLQYTAETAWKTYACLRGAWATTAGVLIAKAVKVGAKEFPPDAFKDVLGAEIKVMNKGCKGTLFTLFCTAKVLLRRELFAEIEKKFFPDIKQDPVAETKGAGAEETKEETKTEETKTEETKTEETKTEETKDEPKKTEEEPKKSGMFGNFFGS